MKLHKTTLRKNHHIDVGFITFLTRMMALLIIALGISLLARAGDAQELPFGDYPNAIRISADDLNSMMVGNDPYGILNYLSLQTGLTFRSTGDFGAEDWFTIRGFGRDNSRLTLVLVDGRPINLVGNHTVEFGDIPVGLIEEIVIYPGPVPSEYGGFQFVVDIKTRQGEILEATAALGSLNSYWMNTTIASDGRFYYRANLDISTSDGQTGQRLLGVLDHYVYSDRFDRAMLPSLKLGYRISDDFDLSIEANLLDVKKMFGTGLHYGEEQSRTRKGQNYTLRLRPGNTSVLDYGLTLYFTDEEEWLNTEFPEDTTYNVNWGTHERQKFGASAFYRQSILPGRLWFKAGGEAHVASGKTDNDYLYFQWEDEQSFYGAYMTAELVPWDGGRLQAGGRLDGQSYLDDVFLSPNVAFSQNLMNNRLQLYGSYGMSSRWLPVNKVNTFKRPARPLGPPFLAGNVMMPEIDPAMERFTGLDLGLRKIFFEGKLSGRINYFYLVNEGTAGAPLFEMRPLKDDAQIPPGTGIEVVPVAYDRNLPGKDINEGLEAHVELMLNNRLRVFANATYTIRSETTVDEDIILYDGPLGGPGAQEIINNSAGQFLIPYAGRSVIPGAYDWLANLVAAYSFSNGALLNLNLRYRSESADPLMKFNLDPQTDKIDSVFLLDIGGQIPLRVTENYQIKAIGRISNLFDTTYSTFVHYPMAGRFISAGISLNMN